MKRILLLVPLLLLAATSSGMVLTNESFSDGPPGSYNEASPDWCYHEDSSHWRTWQGQLAPGESFDVPILFCNMYEEGRFVGGAGGVRFYYSATFPEKASFVLKAVYPNGTVRLAHLVSPGYVKGCVLYDTFPGTTFHVVFTNTGTRAMKPNEVLTEFIMVDMADDTFRNVYCPVEDR
jgi:hypothetical protein